MTGDDDIRAGLPDEASNPDEVTYIIELIAEKHLKRHGRLDLFDDVVSQAETTVLGCHSDVIPHCRQELVGTEEFEAAYGCLRTLVRSAYDSVSGRKRLASKRESNRGEFFEDPAARHEPDAGLSMDVGEAMKKLNADEAFVMKWKSHDCSDREIAAELSKLSAKTEEVTEHQVRRIREQATEKLRIYLRSYNPKRND